MKNILIPVDGSRDSYRALDIAATLAKAHNATATVIHVISHTTPTSHERELIEAEFADELAQRISWPESQPGNSVAYARTVFDTQARNNRVMKDILGRIVADKAAHVLQVAGVEEVNSVTKDGNVADQILKAADEQHTDTIIMGTRGLSDVQGFLLGSASHKVTHSAKCNVILVK